MTRPHPITSIDPEHGLRVTDANADWKSETPVPLDRHDLADMPPGTFGGWLGDIIDAAAKAYELPPAFVAMMALPAVATCVQGKFSLLIESGYFEPLNIWTIGTLGPSNRKSSCVDTFADPLKKWERDQAVVIKPVIDQAKSERESLELTIKEYRKRASKLTDPSERRDAIEEIKKLEAELPEIPVYPSLLFDDATPEEIARSLSVQNERMSYIESEADALFGMLCGRYSGNDNFDLVLKTYRGESKRVTRRHAAPIDLRHPLMSIGVGPQPGLIQDQIKNPALIKRGFLARFLLAVPKSNLGFRKLKPRPISDPVLLAYESRLLELLAIEPNLKDDRQVPHVVKLSNGAYQKWKSFQRQMEALMRPDGRMADEALTSWAGKLAGNVARLSALIQIGEQVGVRPDTVPITEDAMDRAIEFGEVLIDHAIAFHDLADHRPEMTKAKELYQWLKSRAGQSEISVREMQQSLKRRSLFPKVEDVREALEVLVDHGWVMPKIDPNAGYGQKPKTYFIHPEMRPQCPQNQSPKSTIEHPQKNGDIGDHSTGFENSKPDDEIEVIF